MARPPVRKGNEGVKAFKVADGHCVMDFDGNKVPSGGTIMLTKKQAQFFQKSGSVTYDLGSVFDDDNADDAPTNTPKESAEPEADASGDDDTGDSAEPATETKRTYSRRS